MYSFEPSEEQKMLIDSVGRFAANDLRPAARAWDESAGLPRAVLRKGWELGLLQASIPEAYGGFGDRSAVTGALAAETLAYGDLAAAFALGTPGLFALPILLGGSEAQKQQYLPGISGGDWQPFTAALVEYNYDFDPRSLHATAELQGDHYVLNGEKAFVPYAAEAPALLVSASAGGASQGFIVPGGAPGLSISTEREKLMGVRAFPLYRLRLQDVAVPVANRLGGAAGHDFDIVLASMRIAQAAAAVGVAKAAFEYSRDYAKEREAFGVKIAQKQAIAFMLAEMGTELEASRLLTWQAAWELDAYKAEACNDAYMAATGAMDMAMMVSDRAVQILGGHGYIREHPVEMWMRNARGFASFTGLTIV